MVATWHGAIFPEAHAEIVALIPEAERGDLLEAYCRRILSDDPAISLPAARAWSRYEGSCLHLLPRPEVIDAFGSDAIALGVGRLEAHYFRNRCFLAEGELLTNVSAIRHLPAIIVQGRYDVITPPKAAWALQQSWPEAHLFMVEDAGHSASEPGTAAALVAATEWFKTLEAPAPP